MTRAELLLDERRFDEAQAVLARFTRERSPARAALFLMLRAEQGTSNWNEVLRIANALEKHDAMPGEALASLRASARVALLSRKPFRSGRSPLANGRHAPRRARSSQDSAAAARAFMALGDCRSAHRIIEEASSATGRHSCVALRRARRQGCARAPRARGKMADRSSRRGGAAAHSGRLCVQRELWGKAQSYLEASLATQPTQAAHIALARLYERLGRAEEAGRHFRASADLVQPTPD